MPEVRMSVGKALIGREEVAPSFEIRGDDGALIGELTVSTGGVRWRPRHLQSAYFADWAAFDRVMESQRKEPVP
jgi:hypothetical protein